MTQGNAVPTNTANTIADIVALRLSVQGKVGNDDRRAELKKEINVLEGILRDKPDIDISKPIRVIQKELDDQPKRYYPLAAVLLLLIAAAVGLWFLVPGISENAKFLGFNVIFLITAVGAGFLGSFVRVLNKVLNYEYSAMSRPTVTLVMILRPIAGASLGLFVAALFAAGGIATPIVGSSSDEIFSGVSKGAAFIFAVAFIAGLVDDFALNVANRFATSVKGSNPEARGANGRDNG